MKKEKYACPCCGYLTLEERGIFEICPVCFWEDDGQDDENADEDIIFGFLPGPNGISLREARENYGLFGACEKEMIQYVRKPRKKEVPIGK